MNPSKYIEQLLALEEQAKREIIELLKNNPKGRFIQPNEHHNEDEDDWDCENVMTNTGDDELICLTAVGLRDDGELLFRVTDIEGQYYNDYDWFTLDKYTHPYFDLYEFVVNHLDDADEKPFEFQEED